mmetsp:Transcript_64473/g.197240  ORF Transcript_64473/g.197240 Transcript_64473/m.197240 type:complete len:510 (-) Transcript_64473:73-1602(-)
MQFLWVKFIPMLAAHETSPVCFHAEIDHDFLHRPAHLDIRYGGVVLHPSVQRLDAIEALEHGQRRRDRVELVWVERRPVDLDDLQVGPQLHALVEVYQPRAGFLVRVRRPKGLGEDAAFDLGDGLRVLEGELGEEVVHHEGPRRVVPPAPHVARLDDGDVHALARETPPHECHEVGRQAAVFEPHMLRRQGAWQRREATFGQAPQQLFLLRHEALGLRLQVELGRLQHLDRRLQAPVGRPPDVDHAEALAILADLNDRRGPHRLHEKIMLMTSENGRGTGLQLLMATDLLGECPVLGEELVGQGQKKVREGRRSFGQIPCVDGSIEYWQRTKPMARQIDARVRNAQPHEDCGPPSHGELRKLWQVRQGLTLRVAVENRPLEVVQRLLELPLRNIKLVVSQAQEVDLRVVEALDHHMPAVQRGVLGGRQEVAVHHRDHHTIELLFQCARRSDCGRNPGVVREGVRIVHRDDSQKSAISFARARRQRRRSCLWRLRSGPCCHRCHLRECPS